MSQGNVTTVQAAFEAMERGGLDALADYWTDDVDHRAIQGSIDDRGPMHGKEAVHAYLQDWFDMFDDFTVKPVELIDAGEDEVVAVLRIGGRAKKSGVETELTVATVYTIREGKIARGREYATREEALEAAGLKE
jgi:ketosteroid isomerase-like protein